MDFDFRELRADELTHIGIVVPRDIRNRDAGSRETYEATQYRRVLDWPIKAAS